jgi:hypothetical protein
MDGQLYVAATLSSLTAVPAATSQRPGLQGQLGSSGKGADGAVPGYRGSKAFEGSTAGARSFRTTQASLWHEISALAEFSRKNRKEAAAQQQQHQDTSTAFAMSSMPDVVVVSSTSCS